MNVIRKLGAALVAITMVGGLSLAQAPEGPPKPGPEHKELTRFVGTWTGKAEMKDGPFGPGGPMTWTETCEWFHGGFAVVCKSEGKGPMGETKGLGIMSYDPEKKAYTYYGVDSTGWSELSHGKVNGKVWTFESHGTMDGKPMHGRFTVTEVSDAKQTFSWEISEDGKTWKNMMTGESNK